MEMGGVCMRREFEVLRVLLYEDLGMLMFSFANSNVTPDAEMKEAENWDETDVEIFLNKLFSLRIWGI